jgi:hypothetical protein
MVNGLRPTCLEPFPGRADTLLVRRIPTIQGLALGPQQIRSRGMAGHHAALQQLLEGKRERSLGFVAAAVGACRNCNLWLLMCCHRKIGHDPFAPRFLSPS